MTVGVRWTRTFRLGVAVAAGGVTATVCGFTTPWQCAVMLFWVALAAAWVVPVWVTVVPLGPSEVEEHSTREDPGLAAADTLLLAASVAAIAAVVIGVVKSSGEHGSQKVLLLGAGIAAVVSSWVVVHTVFALRYAALYYATPEGGIDFGGHRPTYADFAYVAFTIGMTYQVSDTGLRAPALRRAALLHGLLSYLLGTVVIAATINLAAGLAR